MSSPAAVTCAAPDCEQPVHRTNRTGRPAIYCTPACRPSRNRTPRQNQITVEVEHPEASPDGRPTERVWAVRLKRGDQIVEIADGLGWPSATALARALDNLLDARPRPAAPGRPTP
ncbi:MAG TPA: hypothetical protein VNF71_10910 [Acidimicrobiales bacterium]|jgi:hypothetical protein|nr:hypothetical protein [Acidimicrobiales bacterium]